jgi:hypothetical protein
MRRLLGVVCAAATVSCGNGALTPPPDSKTAPAMTPDVGSGALDAASSNNQVPATDAASAPDVGGPDAASAPDVGGPDVPPGRVPYRAIALTVGEDHACVILDDHKVKCWGANFEGQLGLGDTKPRGVNPSEMGDNLPTVDLGTGRTAKAISARVYTTCALLDDDSVKCWGDWWSTAFPNGTEIGDDPGEMGDNLAPIDLGGRKATSVVLGRGLNCVTTDDQSVLCRDDHYDFTPVTLRPGATVVDLAVGYSGVALYSDGSIWSLGGPPTLQFTLDAGTHARGLFGAYATFCATLDTGGLKCWALDVDDPPGDVAPPTAATDVESVAFTLVGETCVLKKSGAVECTNNDPLFGVTPAAGSAVPLGRPAVAIDGGGQAYVCALLDDGSVKCWGESAPQVSAPWLGDSDPAAPGWPAVNLGTRSAP